MNSSSPHGLLYAPPPLRSEDEEVLGEIHQMRKDLRHVLRTPRRWEGGLRRSAQARAIQGSNSIEGYEVEEDDAAAVLDGEEPLSADDRTSLEIWGYRQALGYVLAKADDPHTVFSTTEILAMHYMMLSHDQGKSPGRYREGPIYVRDERHDAVVYEAPDKDQVPALMDALVESLRANAGVDPVVRSAMAHLNLVMIHPFRDGNGRMARALATFVLTRSAIAEPVFSSIEEWLGANTEDYYSALAHTGHGSWQPRDDAHLWLAFCLRAHHMQAQTVARRVREAEASWIELEKLVRAHDLPERTIDGLFEAVLGYRLRRTTYARRASITDQSATRDLAALASEGLLVPHGTGRGRYYTGGEPIEKIREQRRSQRTPLRDPFPWMRPTLSTPTDPAAMELLEPEPGA